MSAKSFIIIASAVVTSLLWPNTQLKCTAQVCSLQAAKLSGKVVSMPATNNDGLIDNKQPEFLHRPVF